MKQLIILYLSVFCVQGTYAKAAFDSKAEMIKKATNIVIVSIVEIKDGGKRKSFGTSRNEIVKAEVSKNVKGKRVGEVAILNIPKEDSLLLLTKGAYILFLRKVDGKLYVSNGHIGARKIEKDELVWFPKGHVMRGDSQEIQRLEEVLKDIKAIMKADKQK